MPYALFDHDAKVSKAYPTKDDVWRHAEDTGLVVDQVSDEKSDEPRRVLDNGYQIQACHPDPGEDPEKNEAEAPQDLGTTPTV
jgi:hypothetical protein